MEAPFELTANPRFLFLTPQHREALSNLQYGLFSAKAITVLIGEAGTGKTTLIQAALDSERCRHVRCVYINNPTLTRTEFVELLARRFELSDHARESKAALLTELERELHERRARGEVTALVIDEAQSLSDELLEEIRLLANSETVDEKLLPVVLAGQPALAGRLNEPQLLQLKQRVTLRCEIAPFKLEVTARFGTAGAYNGVIMPTATGTYTFHIVGKIDTQSIDEKFSSGPNTFGDIEDSAAVQYPTKVPVADELGKKLDAISSAVDQTRIIALAALVVALAGIGASVLFRRRS